MISFILNALERGISVMRSNSQMFLIGVLVFVFPIIFVFVTQSFFSTAYDNINTNQSQRVGMLHTVFHTMLMQNFDSSVIQETITDIQQSNIDVTKIRILVEDGSGLRIINDTEPALIGTYESSEVTFRRMGFSEVINFLRFEFIVDGKRTWQAIKRVPIDDTYYYIFSEHDFSLLDSVMSARRQQSYFGLTAIFLFLISLAYWIHKQVNWQHRYTIIKRQLRERDLFSNMIAHEFRSPLTAIKGYASFLQESKTISADEHRFVLIIKDASERLVLLVNDFLEVARLQSGKITITKESVDVRSILTAVTNDLLVVAAEKGLQLQYDQGTKSLIMETDPLRLTQVFTNVISNAIKYTDKGIIKIEASAIPGEITVYVKDNGMGISAEDQQKLFAPFTRVGGVDSGSESGTGLGMWITKQMVSLLGGTIGVESIKGVGTHIVISFRT